MIAIPRANGEMRSCRSHVSTDAERGGEQRRDPRTRAAARAGRRARRATARRPRAARTSRTRSAAGRPRAGGRRAGAARRAPGRRSASARARAGARRHRRAPRRGAARNAATLAARQTRDHEERVGVVDRLASDRCTLPRGCLRGRRRHGSAPDFELAERRRRDGAASPSLRGKPGRPLLLSQGQHVRLHDAGLRDPRRLERVRARRARSCSASRPTGSPRTRSSRTTSSLPFTLLADPDHAVAEAYGVWQEKSRYGRTYMGIVRSTFVIGAGRDVVKAMRNVKPATHADDVLAALASAA